jgi:hypothetical protein
MKRDKRAESLGRGDRIVFANKTLEVKKVVRFQEGKLTKVRVSFKGFRDVEFNLEQLITVID